MHDVVLKWKYFPWYWPFAWGIHRSSVNSPHTSCSREALMFSLICAWINGWVNNREAGDLGCHRSHYDVIVFVYLHIFFVKVTGCERIFRLYRILLAWRKFHHEKMIFIISWKVKQNVCKWTTEWFIILVWPIPQVLWFIHVIPLFILKINEHSR